MRTKKQSHLCSTGSIKVNHRNNLRNKMPTDYRDTLAKQINRSVQLIDLVLGGDAIDYHGIIPAAYKMCIDHNNKKTTQLNELDKLIKEVQLIN